MKIYLIILTTFIFSFSAFAQQDIRCYFDASGKKTEVSNAYYYRELISPPASYKSYYISGKLFFEGQINVANIEDETKNIYFSKCIWYYKNGKKKVEKNFNSNGNEDGLSIYYFESGKKWKELEYKDGVIVDNKYKEYTEQGESFALFEETFDNNNNGWDLYTSNVSSAQISKGVLELKSLTKEGSSRFISQPIKSRDYIIETTFDNSEAKENKVGLLWGFKDWQNYNYIAISDNYFYIGTVYEGVHLEKVDGMFSSELVKKGKNNIKLFVSNGKLIITINGVIQTKLTELKNQGQQIGFVVSEISTIKVDNLVIKEFVEQNSVIISNSELYIKATGSGILLSTNGYIATNYHVIENNNKIEVDVNFNGEIKTFEAKVVQKDEQNDVAILKIIGDNFKIDKIEYSFSETGAITVGNSVFTIGYPLALSGMGKDVKFVDGKISAKTGFNNAVNSFLTSIPVQPGNSGGPVFNEKGEMIGLINAKISSADNVSYAIKLSYLKNIFDLLPEVPMPSSKIIETYSLEDKIKVLSKYVVLIKIK